MNCKPGDLARTVGIVPLLENANDRIVKLLNQPSRNGFWELEEPVLFLVAGLCHLKDGRMYYPGDVAAFDLIHDDCLRPIRGLPDGGDVLVLEDAPVDQGVSA